VSLIEKWKEFVDKMNNKGIPLPMARDPKTKEGSVAVTLVVVSGGLCSITVLMMLATIISKLSGVFAINESSMTMMRDAFYSSMQFFVASYAGYIGRKMQRNEKGAITLEAEDKEKS
jgi:hypothetical protein